ncbi:MAG: TM1266 family iron-only hydrogenase system putative regulator [Candidatus Omnitrophota bacterium]|nr:iron-only hydrogenase system regulator [Candidatus Omnitrophota bacterium]MBU1894865.1 iron-only hydrogenase system regulator [Candidatus Omnitrophota bacterium]
MDKRLGFVGIIVEDRQKNASKINSILSEFGGVILSRTGIPYKERACSVITLIVDATTDEIGALSGKLGNITGVTVKSALSRSKII